jgi:hypothetical protein
MDMTKEQRVIYEKREDILENMLKCSAQIQKIQTEMKNYRTDLLKLQLDCKHDYETGSEQSASGNERNYYCLLCGDVV